MSRTVAERRHNSGSNSAEVIASDTQGTGALVVPSSSQSSVVASSPVTPSLVSTGAKPVPRRRFQKGSLVIRGKNPMHYGIYREDVLQSNGTFRRVQRWVPLGFVSEMSVRAAWKALQLYLDRVNQANQSKPKTGITLADFLQEWRASVAANLKGSTVRAVESHFRAHILPKLGGLPLTDMTTKTVQSFVAYLASGGRSRKTAENVLLTLSSVLRTARAWDYACGNFKFSDLTLPREGVKKEQRCFSDEEIRRIIAAAPEPLAPF